MKTARMDIEMGLKTGWFMLTAGRVACGMPCHDAMMPCMEAIFLGATSNLNLETPNYLFPYISYESTSYGLTFLQEFFYDETIV